MEIAVQPLVIQVIDTAALILVGVIGWLLARAVRRLDGSIDKIMEMLMDHERRVSHLEGVGKRDGYSR
jgi:hypothetical protein